MIINSKYIQVDIKTDSKDQKEILIAELSELGYEFEEDRNILKAFISGDDFDVENLEKVLSNQNLPYTLSDLSNKNWNEEWEQSFQPVVVDDFCCIRASFHQPIPEVKHDLIVTPQMSFGTGHHATTYMMVQAMQQVAIQGKTVFDFGTGTGVLAILAAKLGASKIVAMDNDEWSIENAASNFTENGIADIELIRADELNLNKQFDIILANINRNVILQAMPAIKAHLAPNGIILFSGLLADDQTIITESAEKERLINQFRFEKDSWICIGFTHQP